MKTLVIETATAACSVALIDGSMVLASAHDVVGRGHAERLVPMIADLPGQGRADRILVDVGPGSFTGVRVGLAAATGLSIGWGVPAVGFSSLSLVAAAGFAAHPHLEALAAVLEGGHGELFVQQFAAPLAPVGTLRSLKPADVLEAIGTQTVIGSGIPKIAAIAPDHPLIEALPNAADAHLLAGDLASLPPRPIYGRAPDAKTLAERGLA